jgi:hypothetical protein
MYDNTFLFLAAHSLYEPVVEMSSRHLICIRLVTLAVTIFSPYVLQGNAVLPLLRTEYIFLDYFLWMHEPPLQSLSDIRYITSTCG